jgi:hypothetical protein
MTGGTGALPLMLFLTRVSGRLLILHYRRFVFAVSFR